MPAALVASTSSAAASNTSAATAAAGKKRSAAASGLDQRPHRPVKRRASKACQCCRSRKVRCNVVEHGAPCTNCRLDQVECIIMESKRRRKSISRLDAEPVQFRAASDDTSKARKQGTSSSQWNAPAQRPVLTPSTDGHVPHPLYRNHEQQSPPAEQPQHQTQTQQQRPSFSSSLGSDFASNWNRFPLLAGLSTDQIPPVFTPPAQQSFTLPGFVRPLPQRLDPLDAAFLQSKGAFDLPNLDLRHALLQAYVEFVDPSMPILEVNEFLTVVDCQDGAFGKVSLLVLQAVMFAGSTFVDLAHLRRAGFQSRQQARKSFYQRARLLYDFDYDTDRVALLQAALLMTYWYEAPDDQKDTWYWMGIAITVAASIGLNRDPSRSNLDMQRQRLWKRMWWSCIIRDSLIAIGMRRPLRIKPDEHDVPMLTLDDFTLGPLSSDISSIPSSCLAARSSDMRKKLALVFIEQARLSTCICHVIATQYALPSSSVSQEGKMALARLLPKKDAEDTKKCSDELASWMADLSEEVRLPDSSSAPQPREWAPYYLNRALTHMEYYMALSALHRPQAITPSSPAKDEQGVDKSPAAQVRLAAFKITDLAQSLHQNNFSRFLPTTGITVLQPALISHLLDVRSDDRLIREDALRGFCQCFQVLSRLRDYYPGAEYSVAMLDAGVRRADIDSSGWFSAADQFEMSGSGGKILSSEALVEAGLRLGLVAPPGGMDASPPASHEDIDITEEPLFATGGVSSAGLGGFLPYAANEFGGSAQDRSDEVLARRLGMFLATTPPASSDDMSPSAGPSARDLEREFESLINVDDLGDALALGDGGLTSMQGESSGFMLDIEFPNALAASAPRERAPPTNLHLQKAIQADEGAASLATPDESDDMGGPSDAFQKPELADDESSFDDMINADGDADADTVAVS